MYFVPELISFDQKKKKNGTVIAYEYYMKRLPDVLPMDTDDIMSREVH